jgi:hypothetical protein
MGSFPMSVANNFCDQPLPKYLDSKTVLIYCPHPVGTLVAGGYKNNLLFGTVLILLLILVYMLDAVFFT